MASIYRTIFFCTAVAAVFLSCVFLSSYRVEAYVSPGQPTGYLNDFSGVLSSGIKSELEQKLVQFHTETSNEVVVVLVPTIGNDYIESYTLSLAEDWKIADAKKDNAVILLLAIDDRKVRVEVGYGLEGALPDSVANSIIREMVPSLKESNYDGAVQAGVEKIIAATKNEYVGSPAERSEAGNGGLFEVIIFFGLFVLQWLASVLGRSKAWWPGGAIGFVGASVLALFGIFSLSLVAYAALILFATFFGAFFDYVVSNTYQHDNRLGTNHPWWVGGGSGSSFGGGFGGFGGGGGGSFGGGGSSGSW